MKSIVVGSFEAKNRLSELLNLASKGQEILITRRNKPVARLIGETDNLSREAGMETDWVERSRRIRQRAAAGKETIKDLIEEGRS